MADSAAAPSSSGTGSKTPADFLKSIKGRPVIVKLNSGSDYRGRREGVGEEGGRRTLNDAGDDLDVSLSLTAFSANLRIRIKRRAGTLACLDGYMNIAMENTEVKTTRKRRRKRGRSVDSSSRNPLVPSSTSSHFPSPPPPSTRNDDRSTSTASSRTSTATRSSEGTTFSTSAPTKGLRRREGPRVFLC